MKTKQDIVYPTWDEIKAMPTGTIIKDWYDEGVRCLIMRGPSSLCAYVGIPSDHPLAGHAWDDVPLSCHYGLTFASEGSGNWPEGFYWYGWDYAHSGDYSFYYDDYNMEFSRDDKKWTVKDVESDMWSPVYDFKKMMRLCENINKKVKTTNLQ